ncbi:MAG: hypothetical protein ABI140_21980, partial [Jatrophihabitantaceae bacterium]
APDARGELAAAIEATEQAYHLIEPTDPLRPQAAGQLGRLLGVRFIRQGTEADRDAAIAVLTVSLASPDLPRHTAMMQMTLGQLYLSRVLDVVTVVAAGGFVGQGPVRLRADADAAIRHLREALQGPSIGAPFVATVQALLGLLYAMRPMLAGERADYDKIMAAMGPMRQVLQPGGLLGDLGVAESPVAFPIDLSRLSILDFPALDLTGDPEQPPAVPPRRPAAVPKVSSDPDVPRRAARDRLAGLSPDPDEPVWEQARALLAADVERLPVQALDGYVSAAGNAVGVGPEDDSLEAGLDRLLAAVGLGLRRRRDGSGWDEEVPADGCIAAAELLLAASSRIPAEHPAAAVVLEALYDVLAEAQPLSGAIAGQLAEYAAAVRPAGVLVAALCELCRVVAALAVGAPLEPARFAGAVADLPADHARRGMLSTAVGHARLAAAVRAGPPATVDTALHDLAPLLDAVLRDDPAALREAVTRLAGPALQPRIAAVLGACHLELAVCPATTGQDDLLTAIALLSASAGALGDTDERLRTRTWWRLAQAHRSRGDAGDAETSRKAGVEALRGADSEPADAARFASWMLADGHAEDAYRALEVMAAGSDRFEAGVRPLAQDILNLIVGIRPRSARPAEVMAPEDVAAALRKVGASALLYLHPTDETGRTTGVLCLDAGTRRLEVLANVPATDPLTTDDPGWSAIGGRWRGGRLLVAARGDLSRVALPAVRVGGGRRLAQEAGIAHVSSGRQLIGLAGRTAAPVDRAPLFVVNPRGDRDAEMAEVLVLRRLFHPRSACVGRALESLDGPGTRDELLLRLPYASLVHLACGVRGTVIELAGGEALDLATVGGGGLVILAEPAAGGLGVAAEALLDAGFSGVIGWQRPVPGSFAAVAVFMAHVMLIDHQLSPAAAVTAVQRWLLDPDRELPPLLSPVHRHTVEHLDLSRQTLWAALAYYGC